jgi:uncharacterized damage-inducible protein DinB
MPEMERETLTIPAGHRSPVVALFVAQLDDQARLLLRDTRALRPADLAWQPARGMNTIGMLLAHIAIVEVFWIQVAGLAPRNDMTGVLGIHEDDDGMPLASGGRPPALLRGRDIAFYADLLSRARAHTRRAVAELTDADLDREVTRQRRDGTHESFDLRWILYHLLEHFAGHYGQILLLAHQRRDRMRAGSAGGSSPARSASTSRVSRRSRPRSKSRGATSRLRTR